jgi:hypothetical protein
LRLCLDRIIAPGTADPARRAADPQRFRHRSGDGAIVKAAAQGTIAPDEAFKLSQMIDTFVRAIDTSDFDKRLQMLENGHAEEAANAVGWNGR